jgi:hypothetical protein
MPQMAIHQNTMTRRQKMWYIISFYCVMVFIGWWLVAGGWWL